MVIGKTMASEEIECTIEIVCTEPPQAGPRSLHLGIQRDEAISELASVDSKRIVFRPTFRARRNADGSVNFLGPFAHGPKVERFVYLIWTTTTVPTAMVGRIKLHLNHIQWDAVERSKQCNKPIRAYLVLTNSKGGPVRASVHADVAKWELP